MHIRMPAVADQFYPGDQAQCVAAITAMTRDASAYTHDPAALVGGITPHAGWMFSGAVACEVINALATRGDIETFVVFGAVHRKTGPYASVFARGQWRTPVGDIEIDEPLAEAIVAAANDIREDPAAHGPEHSIEVETPFIQRAAQGVKLLPIMIPPLPNAHELGQVVAEQATQLGRNVAYVASTDLTHYGPRYGFTPEGVGPKGCRWAKEVNDQRMIDLILDLRDDAIVGEAIAHQNACGSGAIAATIAACKHAGATRAHLLRHVTSNEIMPERLGESPDAVGYAGIVLTR